MPLNAAQHGDWSRRVQKKKPEHSCPDILIAAGKRTLLE
jgi:hypothetical protein